MEIQYAPLVVILKNNLYLCFGNNTSPIEKIKKSYLNY